MLLENLKKNKIMNRRKYSNKCLQETRITKSLHIYLPTHFPIFERKFLNPFFKYTQRTNTYSQQTTSNILSNEIKTSIYINTSKSSELCCWIPFLSRRSCPIFECLALLMWSLYDLALQEFWACIILTSENYF